MISSSPLNSKDIKSINPQRKSTLNIHWNEFTDAEAETPILGHLTQRTDSLEKILMLRKVEGRKEEGNRG